MKLDFSEMKVLLIGDFMADIYIYGSSSRMSPEAPVPVVDVNEVKISPGGAGNVAMNLRSFGAQVSCIGSVGDDKEGLAILKMLQDKKIDTNLISTSKINTITKKRYFANGKQILRIDREQIDNMWQPVSIDELQTDKFDVIIMSDYNKGVLNNNWFNKINSKNIIVDPKKDNFSFYKNANIITPNLNELQRTTNIDLVDEESIIKVCNKIIYKNNLDYIIAKRGDKGMMVCGKNNYLKIIEPHKVKNPDVTGAGDTVIAALSLAYTKFGDIEKSAIISNAAASIAVSKKGTSFPKIAEIEELLSK